MMICGRVEVVVVEGCGWGCGFGLKMGGFVVGVGCVVG